MTRNKPRKKKEVSADSTEGQEALAKMMEAYKDDIPEIVQQCGYDGNARRSIKRDVVVKIRTMPVAWAIPFDEIVFSKWVVNMIGFRMMPWDDHINALSTYLPDARNIVHRRFVEDSSAPYMVMLDSDVMPPPDFLNTLLAHKKPIVGGWYKSKGEPYSPVVYDMREELDDNGWPLYKQRTEAGTGLESVDAAGAGLWLMSREVAEALGPTPYSMEQGGEDLYLCRKIHEAGYKTYVDWSVAAAHCGVAIA